MISFRDEALLASNNSKSGKGSTTWMDREVFQLSTEVVISTSLIHPTRKCLRSRELVRMKFRDLKSLLVRPTIRKKKYPPSQGRMNFLSVNF